MKVTFEVPGEPQGKARARVCKYGAFTPEKTVVYENLVKLCFQQATPSHVPFTGAVKIDIIACYGIPKSASKKKVDAMLVDLIRPTKKPDCDNIMKVVCDALNGVAYKDDSQIVYACISKVYCAAPRVYVEIEAPNDTFSLKAISEVEGGAAT